MDYTGLMLPLFFTTIADTKLGGSKGFSREDALPEHWQLVGLCLEYNLRHLPLSHMGKQNLKSCFIFLNTWSGRRNEPASLAWKR